MFLYLHDIGIADIARGQIRTILKAVVQREVEEVSLLRELLDARLFRVRRDALQKVQNQAAQSRAIDQGYLLHRLVQDLDLDAGQGQQSRSAAHGSDLSSRAKSQTTSPSFTN